MSLILWDCSSRSTGETQKIKATPAMDRLANGQRQYHLRGCQKCHGIVGDGNGTRAGRYAPDQRPRDFRNLETYQQGYELENIIFTLRNGMVGDSESIMPKYPFLTDEEISHISEYVIFLQTNEMK